MQTFSGVVIRGSQRAARLGFPTINIVCDSKDISGIYAARAVVNGVSHIAAAFYVPERPVLEAHLIDGTGDLYGMSADITLYKKIRDNKPYESDESLRTLIASDVAAVRAYFAHL